MARFNKTVVQLEKGLPPNNVTVVLKAKVDNFRTKVGLWCRLFWGLIRRRTYDGLCVFLRAGGYSD